MLILVQSNFSWSKTISSSRIVSQTLKAMSCLKYNPVAGICFWLVCGAHGCKIKTSVKVKHWNPDVVVSSYTTTGKSTWKNTRSYSTGSTSKLGAGDDTNSQRSSKRQHSATTFREVDAVGNPALAAMWLLSGTGYMCPSVTYPYVPHFLSSKLDFINWRFASIEMIYPASLVPGMREIGSWPMNTWGAVYPRTGFVTSNEGPKASAVAAQRVGDIITRNGQPHIYYPLGRNCSKGRMKCWAPGPLKEMDATSGKWQMLAPKAENSCKIFGQNDVTKLQSWADNKWDQDHDFAWNLWREYSCCKRKGHFLFSIDF
ncbi:MAG: TIGR03756 family integrating conjugative element protein [gamma proteobacterium symbiont of Lucinoma myriamae]|nr:TIGR03756 family integrating conjugative element protein [gamma proteobacterium symbiont of Lucinoma myriamae]